MDGTTESQGPLRSTGAALRTALDDWVRDRCDGLAAAMAFHVLLAAPPFLALILMISAAVFGAAWSEAHILPALLAWLGPDATSALGVLWTHHGIDTDELVVFSVAGAVGMVVGGSSYFVQMEDALAAIWNVRRSEAGLVVQLRRRARAFVRALGSALLILPGLVAAGMILSVDQPPDRPLLDAVRVLGEALVAFLVFWALASFWLRAVPPVMLTWRQILPWSGLIALLHLLGRLVLTWRAADASDGPGIEAAESLVLAVLWAFYAAMMFLYGAELMRVWLTRSGAVSQKEACP